jgi:hypothetical protein
VKPRHVIERPHNLSGHYLGISEFSICVTGTEQPFKCFFIDYLVGMQQAFNNVVGSGVFFYNW